MGSASIWSDGLRGNMAVRRVGIKAERVAPPSHRDKTICIRPAARYHDAMDKVIMLGDETATVRLARQLASVARPGDVLALHGDLGAGKTALARAFIRARAGDDGLTVPSPTFTLVQTYDLPGGPVWHVDAYRLATADEAFELGLDEAFAVAITLIEWPEHVESLIPAHALHIYLDEGPTADSRRLTLLAPTAWEARLKDLAQAHEA